MRRLFRRVQQKIGTSPGTIEYGGTLRSEPVIIKVIDYDEQQITEKEAAGAEGCATLKDSKTISWIDVNGVHDTDVVKPFGEIFGIHGLVLEDVVNVNQRPKIEEHQDYVFVVLRMLFADAEQRRIESEQVSIIFGENYVLTFQERPGDVFDPVRERLRRGGRIRSSGADYLAYALIDAIVDHYFVVLEAVGDRIEDLDEEVTASPSQRTLESIHVLKRETIIMRKPIWPVREVVDRLYREEIPLIKEPTRMFFRDVYDHVISVMDAVESYREVLASVQDLYLSNVSNRMNDVMKVLTIFATIFVPLTFLAGIYGMNFEYMPELRWKMGYPMFWLVSAATGAGLLAFFRSKKWL